MYDVFGILIECYNIPAAKMKRLQIEVWAGWINIFTVEYNHLLNDFMCFFNVFR